MPSAAARVLALVAAVAMVGGALWFRLGRDGGDGGGGDRSEGPLRVACVAELEDVCRAVDGRDGVEVVVEPAGQTADKLATASEVDIDAWVTLSPWPAMVDVERREAGASPRFPGGAVLVASSPLAALVTREAVEACGEVTWDCLGDAAARGELQVGIPATEEALAVIVAAQALRARLGSASFDRLDIDAEEPWLSDILDSAPRRASEEQATQAVTLSQYDAVPTLEAFAASVAGTSQGRSAGVLVVALAPAVRVDVFVAAGDDGVRDRIAELLRSGDGAEALRGQGWDLGPPDGPSGLPEPDVLVALRDALD